MLIFLSPLLPSISNERISKISSLISFLTNISQHMKLKKKKNYKVIQKIYQKKRRQKRHTGERYTQTCPRTTIKSVKVEGGAKIELQ